MALCFVCQCDNGLRFDGIDDYVSVPSSSAYDSSTGTWAFWMKTNAVWGTNNSDSQNRGVILSRHSPSGSANGLFVFQTPASGGFVNVQAKSCGGTTRCSIAGPKTLDNLWHHIAVTFSRSSGGAILLYKDGVLAGSCTNSAAWTFNNQALRFARSIDAFWEEWKGNLDDVRSFNRVLTAQEVNELFMGVR